ncbi:hypothetical protein BH23PAT2_BH23PAT2_05210 [soil metagenome]
MFKKSKLTVISLAFVLSLAAVPAVTSAQDERGNDRRAEAQVEAQAEPQARQADRQAMREEKQAEIQERVETRQAQVRADVCERRQEQLAQLIPRLANQSSRLNGVIDDIYVRVQGFYESGQLTVDDYETLNNNVANARAEAQVAVEVVATYEFEFDCENTSVGDQLVGFRESVAEARTALKAYRNELVTLISSLRAEAAASENEEETEVEETETESETEEEVVNSEEGSNDE